MMERQNIVYRVIRCKRKTTALYVKEGEVTVRAPFFVTAKEIDAFVTSHRSWILQKQQEQLRLRHKKEQFAITGQSTMTVLGREYPVAYGSRAYFDGAVFTVPQGPFAQIRPHIIAEYQRLAKAVIEERVRHYSSLTGWKAESVRIGSAKTRWGSCSGKNKLNFTWKLIFADINTIDYVVLHELAHTQEHNHGPRFWNLIAQYMPGYQKSRQHLLAVQEKLSAENWD